MICLNKILSVEITFLRRTIVFKEEIFLDKKNGYIRVTPQLIGKIREDISP